MIRHCPALSMYPISLLCADPSLTVQVSVIESRGRTGSCASEGNLHDSCCSRASRGDGYLRWHRRPAAKSSRTRLYGDDAPVQADDDAQDPLWYSLYEMYRVHLAFDHFGILYDAATHWIAAQQPEWVHVLAQQSTTVENCCRALKTLRKFSSNCEASVYMIILYITATIQKILLSIAPVPSSAGTRLQRC